MAEQSLMHMFSWRRLGMNIVALLSCVCLNALIAIGCSNARQASETVPPAVSNLPTETKPSPDSQNSATKETTSRVDCWHRLAGQIGSAAQYGAGWVQLATMASFKQGSRLRLSVGGAAGKIVVRLLSRGEPPDSPSGIVGVFTIPSSRVVLVTLDGNFQNVIQISVHGGPNPWGLFPLGGGNGGATLIKAEAECP